MTIEIKRRARGFRPENRLCSWTFVAAFFEGAEVGGGAAAAAEGAGAASAAGSATGAASSASAAGSGAATAAGTGSSISASSIVSGGVQAFGTLASIRAGQINSQMLKGQARDSELQGKAEYVQGLQDANEARERLLKTLAQQNAAAGAGGLSLEGGSIERGRELAFQEGNRQIDSAKKGASNARDAREAQGAGLRLSARSERTAGAARGAVGLLNAYDRSTKRG